MSSTGALELVSIGIDTPQTVTDRAYKKSFAHGLLRALEDRARWWGTKGNYANTFFAVSVHPKDDEVMREVLGERGYYDRLSEKDDPEGVSWAKHSTRFVGYKSVKN